MQRIETIDEPRDREKARQLSLFDEDAFHRSAHRDDFRNMLIWGDNKLVMASLLEQVPRQDPILNPTSDPPLSERGGRREPSNLMPRVPKKFRPE